MNRLLAGVLLTTALAQAANGADPPKQAEQLPVPRQLPAEPAVAPHEFPPATNFVRDNRWEVWQYYGVDRWGYFKPRVAYSPFGSYYLYNSQPYPFDQVHSRWWLMVQVGTPNRLPPAYMPYVED